MTEKAAKLLEEALQLSAEDRDEIAIELQESLEPVDDRAEPAAGWEAELKRRIEEHEQGKSDSIQMEKALRMIREDLDDVPAD